MNANERRLISLEALAAYHKQLLNSGDTSDTIREKINDVAKTFAKIKKLLVKKNIKVPTADIEQYTKKDWKMMLKTTKNKSELGNIQ